MSHKTAVLIFSAVRSGDIVVVICNESLMPVIDPSIVVLMPVVLLWKKTENQNVRRISRHEKNVLSVKFGVLFYQESLLYSHIHKEMLWSWG
jgi:hypothetical protein